MFQQLELPEHNVWLAASNGENCPLMWIIDRKFCVEQVSMGSNAVNYPHSRTNSDMFSSTRFGKLPFKSQVYGLLSGLTA
jgi:hypothetical protein